MEGVWPKVIVHEAGGCVARRGTMYGRELVECEGNCLRPEMGWCGRKWDGVAGSGMVWPEVGWCGRKWDGVAGSGMVWPEVGWCGWKWDGVAGSGRVRQKVEWVWQEMFNRGLIAKVVVMWN